MTHLATLTDTELQELIKEAGNELRQRYEARINNALQDFFRAALALHDACNGYAQFSVSNCDGEVVTFDPANLSRDMFVYC